MFDIKQMLDIHQLNSYFEVVVSGNDFKQTKPNPEIYQSTMKKLGVTPSETLIIEDSEKEFKLEKQLVRPFGQLKTNALA